MLIFDRKHLLCCAFISVLIISTLLVYANTLNSPFLFDDFNSIVENDPEIHVKELTFSNLKTAAVKSNGNNRPLPVITLAINYYFGGTDTFGYHMVNLLIHLFTGIFLFFLFIATLELPVLADGGSGDKQATGFWAAGIAFLSVLIWMIHPLQTNAVTYIVQRMTSLSAMFYILSMLFYVKGRTSMRDGRSRKAFFLLTGCFLSGVCAVLCKENAATLPLFILLYEWFFLQDLRPINIKMIFFGGLISFIIFCGIAFFFLGSSPMDKILAGYGKWGFTLPERVMTEFRVIAYYFTLMFFPHPDRLMLDYDYPISHTLTDPVTTVVSGVMIALVFVTAVYSAKKYRLPTFCLLWFLGNLMIESSVIGIEIIYEHRLYLPSMMIFLFLIYGGYHIIKTKWARLTIVIGTALVLSLWTYQRNQVWSSDIEFWMDCSQKAPNDARPLQNLAYSIQQTGNHVLAVRYYKQSLVIEEKPETFYNMGLSLSKTGYHYEAIMAFNKAIELNYESTDLYGKLAYELTMVGEFNAAMKNYRQAIKKDPENQIAKDDFNALSTFLRQCRTPMTCVKKLCDQYPQTPELWFKLGYLFEGERKIKQAVENYQKALSLMPESDRQLYLLTLNHLATCYLMTGNIDQATPLFQKGARLSPNDYKFLYQLAALHAFKGDFEQTFTWLEKAITAGFNNLNRLENDTRFMAVKNDDSFKRLKTRIVTITQE